MSSEQVAPLVMPASEYDLQPRVRRAVAADAIDVSRIHNESIVANDATMQEHPTPVARARELIESPEGRSAMLVAEIGNTLVGWGRIWPYSDREGYRFAAETAVFIDRLRRGQGLGTLLQSALIDEGRRLGFHHLVAKIFADNAASIHMHVNLGYSVVGIQQEIGFKRGVWKDVAILQYVHAED